MIQSTKCKNNNNNNSLTQIKLKTENLTINTKYNYNNISMILKQHCYPLTNVSKIAVLFRSKHSNLVMVKLISTYATDIKCIN